MDKTALEQAIRAERQAVLVVNCRSRRGLRFFHAARAALARHGISVVAAYELGDPDHLQEILHEAVRQGPKLIVVGGGDGTISAAVNHFAYQDRVFGLLPSGTGNSFARTLNIPLTLDGAVKVIAHGKVADVDLGQVGDQYFANVADIGLSATIAQETSPALKRKLGMLAYVLVGARILWNHRSFTCCFTPEEGVVRTMRAHEVIVANGGVYGRTVLDAQASADDRQLIVVAMDAANRWRLARIWLAFLFHRHTVFPEVHTFTTRSIRVDADPAQFIDIDGECRGATPALFHVAPQALRVLVPQSFEDR